MCELLAKGVQRMPCLESLYLSWNQGIGCGGTVQLVSSLHSSKLRGLRMARTGISDPDLTTSHCVFLGQLLRHPRHCQIEGLYLSRCGLTSDGVGEVVSGLSDNHPLRELDLRGNKIESEGAVAVATMLKTNSSLED